MQSHIIGVLLRRHRLKQHQAGAQHCSSSSLRRKESFESEAALDFDLPDDAELDAELRGDQEEDQEDSDEEMEEKVERRGSHEVRTISLDVLSSSSRSKR